MKKLKLNQAPTSDIFAPAMCDSQKGRAKFNYGFANEFEYHENNDILTTLSEQHFLSGAAKIKSFERENVAL